MTKRLLALFFALTLVFCTGCTVVLPSNGTLKLDSANVKEITVSNELTGTQFTIQDREDIHSLVKQIASYTLENGQPLDNNKNGCAYILIMTDSAGKELSRFWLLDDSHIAYSNLVYTTNIKDLLYEVEQLECDTKTDKELIDMLMNSDTLDRLNILDADGKVSMDKILGLKNSCPALFELLSRPSILETVGSYGLEAIQKGLESGSTVVQERATELAEILKQYFPDLEEKINDILPK